MKTLIAALVISAAVTAFIAWRMCMLLPSPGPLRGVVRALPLVCLTSGQIVGLAWSAMQGRKVGPWRHVVTEALFLSTMIVVVEG